MLNLLDSADHWPVVGTVTEFEVVHHTHQGHQVRLRPLDPAYRATPPEPIEEVRLRDLKRRLRGDQP
ncbi:hypothetical protein GCM10010198_55300 [Nocardia seriolae]|nr:hypothetical protein NS2_16800 [Nocardia seriolae NBRC 15557]